MESVLASLGALLLRALPTFLILLLLHFYLKAVFFKPLEKALAERRSATSGTREAADASLRRAEQKAKEYEDKLRHARSEIFHEQERLRAQWRSEQTSAVAAVKAKVDAQIQESRERIAGAQVTSKANLAAESEALAEQIARTLLAGRAN
ncbi:MAG: hypothetical protein JNN08_18125 [Bryobacterales bacterium]|nr:hypothetical protein [Bryobacterales bacterium]